MSADSTRPSGRVSGGVCVGGTVSGKDSGPREPSPWRAGQKAGTEQAAGTAPRPGSGSPGRCREQRRGTRRLLVCSPPPPRAAGGRRPPPRTPSCGGRPHGSTRPRGTCTYSPPFSERARHGVQDALGTPPIQTRGPPSRRVSSTPKRGDRAATWGAAQRPWGSRRTPGGGAGEAAESEAGSRAGGTGPDPRAPATRSRPVATGGSEQRPCSRGCHTESRHGTAWAGHRRTRGQARKPWTP